MAKMHLTPELASELDKVELSDDGFVVGRIGFALELYFLGGDKVETRLALCKMLREYHALFADKISHYLKVDANRLTKANGEAYLDYYEEKARSLSPDEAMDTMVFGYPGKKIVDEPASISIAFTAIGPDPLIKLGRSDICAYFPASFVAEHGYGVLLDLAMRWSSAVDILHGSAGYSVLFEHGIYSGSETLTVLPALKRFPGLDFSDPSSFKVDSEDSDGLSFKSINWLTILGDKIANRLGDKIALREKLGSSCPVHEFDGGIVVQAGDEPQLGDNNRGIVLDDYRRVAKALKPVRFEDYQLGLFALPEPYDSVEETLNWVRRFD
ncbi:type VI immunity family protein [Rhizobium oryziradicis]|uniref:type VI immunity family protein n=1 Tax=Rhizobium oryziradicis TaxID=1867956 RepID=UPI0009F840B5|nr:type VI immunity family protein [Rhizobium oryziradicis]